MSFANDIVEVATDLFEKAARKSSYYAQTAKLNVKITTESAGLKDLYAQLGKAYFEGIEVGETESAEFAKELCEKIVGVKGKIDGYKAELEALKKEEAAKAAAAAEEKAAKAAEEPQPEADEDVEITIEVKEPEAPVQPETPPVANLYVDESANSEFKE